mgnify:CR=1
MLMKTGRAGIAGAFPGVRLLLNFGGYQPLHMAGSSRFTITEFSLVLLFMEHRSISWQ